MCFSMLLYRRHKAVSPVADKVTRLEVLPAPLAETEGEYCEALAFQCMTEPSGASFLRKGLP
jgi:hypothetical protein